MHDESEIEYQEEVTDVEEQEQMVGIMINDAALEQALNGSQDTYTSDLREAPNGTGNQRKKCIHFQ